MTPLDLPVGVVQEASKSRNSANWRETNLIRWESSTTMRPVGGWEHMIPIVLASRCRKIHRWAALNGVIYTAYLCENHCYVEIDGVLTDITPVGGIISSNPSVAGYGDYLYGKLKYGTPRPGEQRNRGFTPAFSMGNWGEDLRVMTSGDGRLLGWSPSAVAGTLLTAVTGAPVGNRSFEITPERHIMLFGMAGIPNQFGWCDEENDENWEFADVLSRAGKYEVSPASPIVATKLFQDGIIMHTNQNAYAIKFIGLPYVYQYYQIGECSVPFSHQAIMDVPDGVVWPSVDGFWLFNGTSVRPMFCPLWDFVLNHIDVVNTRAEAVVISVSNKGELWFFFVDKDKAPFNSRMVIYDYRNSLWSMGKLTRTCGMVYGNDENPIMSDGTKVWKHESGWEYPEAPELPWAETFTLNILKGANYLTIKQMMPEIEGGANNLRFRFAMLFDRSRPETEVYSEYKDVRDNGFVDVRETTRDFRMRVDMVVNDNWSLGPILIDAVGRGKK